MTFFQHPISKLSINLVHRRKCMWMNGISSRGKKLLHSITKSTRLMTIIVVGRSKVQSHYSKIQTDGWAKYIHFKICFLMKTTWTPDFSAMHFQSFGAGKVCVDAGKHDKFKKHCFLEWKSCLLLQIFFAQPIFIEF